MLKKLMIRFYHGFAITMLVDLLVHFIVAQAAGSVVTPGFAAHFSCESAAALAQLALVAVIGMTFAGAAMIFEIERWSFMKQGLAHFLITAAVWMPIAYICWAPYSGRGVVMTILGWTLTYAVNWTVQYFIWRRNVMEINRRICALRRQEGEA